MLQVTCVQVVTAVVLKIIYELAGMVGSVNAVRSEPVVVLVIAVAAFRMSVPPPPPARLVLW